MSTCPSCGGEIGRDCYNPTECAYISAQMHQQAHQQNYDDLGVAVDTLIDAAVNPWRTRAETADTALADAKAEVEQLREALAAIVFFRPIGPCRNKLVEQMENIAAATLATLLANPLTQAKREGDTDA